MRGSSVIKEDQRSIKTFGVGRDISKEQWRMYIKDMLQMGYLEQSQGEYPVLKLNEKSWRILKGEERLQLVIAIKEKKEPVSKQREAATVFPVLLQELKQLRESLARKENIPPYLIFSDVTLVELASYLPLNLVDLAKISGFGNVKLAKYGAVFLNLVKAYCREHALSSQIHLKSPRRQRTKSENDNTETKRYTLQLFREGMKLETIAAARELSVGTLETHLAFFVRTGELDVHDLVSKEKVNSILKEVQVMDGTALGPVKQKLGDGFSYGEIRAVLSYWEWMKEAGIEI